MTPCRSLWNWTLAALLMGALGSSVPASAQITLLSSFNPTEVGGLCSVAYDNIEEAIWAYACSDDSLHSFATDGSFLNSIARPGESANDVDLEIAPEAITLAGTTVPSGTLLFINGESGPAEIYALDKATGAVLDTLNTSFGVSHVVGGAYHPIRNTFFLVQDRVPGTADENRIAEVSPATGAVLNSFQITSTFSVNFGDLEVSNSTGNLFVVSSDESSIAEYMPDGSFVQTHALPAGVASLSGIGLDCARREAWVTATGGVISQLGDVPCGVGCSLSFNSASMSPLTVAPGESFTTSVNIANAGPGNVSTRLNLGYTRSGGALSGTLLLGQGTVPQTGGVSASVSQVVPGNAPSGTYYLDLNLVDQASGVVCDTRPFVLTVSGTRLPYAGSDLFEAPPVARDLFSSNARADRAATVRVSPNPASTGMMLRYELDTAASVHLAIYDALGREVAVLVSGARPAGNHAASLDVSSLPPGLYVYRLTVDRSVETGRFTVAR